MLHMDKFLTAYIMIVVAILGAVFGSFINCMAWRMVHKENVLKGRSHCTCCDHPLGAVDLIPVFSYIFLKGRCRYCNQKISMRYMITELFSAFMFVSLVWKYDISFLTLRYVVLACILLGLSLVDLDSYEIPNGCIIMGIVWWIVTIPLMETSIIEEIKNGVIGGFAIGGGVFLCSLVMDFVLKKESMGGGDIKLYFMLGLYTGWVLGLFQLIISCMIGIVFVFVLRRNTIPFAPAISLSALITLLWGNEIVAWYLGLLL